MFHISFAMMHNLITAYIMDKNKHHFDWQNKSFSIESII